MKNLLLFSLTITSLILIQSQAIAQHFDCDLALEFCGEQPFFISGTTGENGEMDSDVNTSCVGLESFPNWLTWTTETAGSLTFVITPEHELDDIDFILYQYSGNCEEKSNIRCMASGETISQDSEICMGPTGLRDGENDTEEASGCEGGSNNFLAPLDVQAGEEYVLLVNNFSSTGLGFSIEFGGTATIDCVSASSTSSISESIQSDEIFTLHPTICNFDPVNISLMDSKWSDSKLTIINSSGTSVYSEMLNGKSVIEESTNLVTGHYLVLLRKAGQTAYQRFVKI